jgi:hypothetical protein
MHLVFGEERLSREFMAERVAERRDVVGEEHGLDPRETTGFVRLAAYDRGSWMRAFDDEGGEDARPGLP